MQQLTQEELCEIYDILTKWEWASKYFPKPEGFDELPNYAHGISKFFNPVTKWDYIHPICEAIRDIVPEKELLRHHHMHNLHRTDDEFERWWFVAQYGIKNPKAILYFDRFPVHLLPKK